MRLIDADALVQKMADNFRQGVWDGCDCGEYHIAEDTIFEAPTIEAEPVRHGRWVFGEMDVLGAPVNCSECGWGRPTVDPVKWLAYPGHKHCGNCGAKMDGDSHE